jgi:iron-sulfur cluster insertion protein
MITLTESAQDKVYSILSEESNPDIALRVFVQGGGCSGFSYGFTLDDTQNEDDFQVPSERFKFLVDAMSMQYLEGASVDYVNSLTGGEFKITNPNATASCGCGSSFTIKE